MRPHQITDEIAEISRDRRHFIKMITTGTAGLTVPQWLAPKTANAVDVQPDPATVSFITGRDRRDMMHQVLEPLKDKIAQGIKGKQVIIKANLVGPDPLCAAHVDAVRGVLDFLKPIYKKRVIVADSTGRTYPGPMGTWKHFDIHGYLDLPRKHKVKLVDLNDMPTKKLWITNENFHASGVNIIDSYLDPDNYIISLTRLKTHNGVVVTLSIKNIVMGSPISHYKQRVAKGRNEKQLMHMGGHKNINFNIFLVSRHVRPHLSIIDGLTGMEGNGPTKGTAVEHGVALAGTDMLAVDRVSTELMGVNFNDVGYLKYVADAGLGQSDMTKITILGQDIRNHVIQYRLHDNIERQMLWKEGLIIDK
ncbi:DUF362 domain-containing protein [Candidatus Latescibacterota bacterium]